jgi:hypothetical protein
MANVIQFTIKGIDKASGPFGKVSSTIGSMTKVVAGSIAVATAAATATVGFVAAVTKGQDQLAKFSLRLGISVTELSEYQHVANLSSISTEQFNLATQRMNRRVAEAAEGLGEAKGALKELNINADEFKSLGLDEQMETLADSMAGVSDDSDKLRLAFKLFDSEGTSVLQMLKKGSAAMQEMAADARFLGLSISEGAAANAEAFQNSLTRATGAMKGLSRGISDELAPLMTGLSNSFADFVASNRERIVTFVKEGLRSFITFGVVVGQVVTSIKEGFMSLFTREGFELFVENAKIAMKAVMDIFINSGPLLVATLGTAFKILWESFFELGKWAFQQLFDFVTGQNLADSLAEVLFERIPAATERSRAVLGLMLDDLGVQFKDTADSASASWQDMFGVNIKGAQEVANAWINSMQEFGMVSDEETENELERRRTLFEELQLLNEEYMDQVGTVTEEMAGNIQGIMLNLSKGIGDAFADSIVGGKKLSDSLRALSKTVLKEMISMMIRIGIQRLVLNKIIEGATLSEGLKGIAAGAAKAGANAFASIAAIPIIGPFLAPIAALAAVAGALAIGRKVIGQADDGLTNVPRGGTFLLDQGERVLSRQQNKDLTGFLNGGEGGSQSVVIEQLNIHVLENATNAEALLEIDPADMEELVAEKFIPALDALSLKGVEQVETRIR